MSYGAVRYGFQKYRKTYGTVRCGISDVVNSTVRFGAILCPHGAALCYFMSYGAVRCVFRYRKTYSAMWCGFQQGQNPIWCGAVRFAVVCG